MKFCLLLCVLLHISLESVYGRAIKDHGERAAAKETTGDYPFTVSGGPKANIHANGNSKIRIGNDHDEDLVDSNDDDDSDSDDKSSKKSDTGSGSGASPSVAVAEAESGSGSDGADVSGDSDSQPYIHNAKKLKGSANQSEEGDILTDEQMSGNREQGDQNENPAASTSESPQSASAQAAFEQTFMLPITSQQCEALQQFAHNSTKNGVMPATPAQTNATSRTEESGNSQTQIKTIGDYIIAHTEPGDAETFRKMIIQLASDCYNAKVKEIEALDEKTAADETEAPPSNDGKKKKKDKLNKKKRTTTHEYKLPIPGDSKKGLLSLHNIKKLNQSLANLGDNFLQLLPIIGPISDDYKSSLKTKSLASEKRHMKSHKKSGVKVSRNHLKNDNESALSDDWFGDEEMDKSFKSEGTKKKKVADVDFPGSAT